LLAPLHRRGAVCLGGNKNGCRARHRLFRQIPTEFDQ
jgi:hypothetical protein